MSAKQEHSEKHSHSDSESDERELGDLISWNSGGNLTNNSGVNDFIKLGGTTTNSENSAKFVITKSGTLKNLVAQLVKSTGTDDASPGEGKSRNFIIRKNGVNTNLAVNISGTDSAGNNSHNKVHVKKFDLISLVHNATGNPINAALGIISVELH